ncbi:MAG: NAD(P)/FAD-dependent oxidoreductase [Acidimicrobiales bacterium]
MVTTLDATTGDRSTQEVDVLVIGGGAAGLAAGLLLARARRSVLLIDGGEPRNAPASHMHGYLGHEAIPPGDFLAIGRDEVRRYGAELRTGHVADVVRDPDGRFRAITMLAGADQEMTGQESTVLARRVLLATGLRDVLPDIPGLAEQWGRGVVHCPYCHGWEVRDQALVVVGTGPGGPAQAALFRQWSDDVTFVVHEGAAPGDAVRERLEARGIRVVERPVVEVLSTGEGIAGVRLAGGEVIPADVVVVDPPFEPRARAIASLGAEPVPDPTGRGRVIETDQMGATRIPGLYAAGNAADARGQVLQAAAAGGMAGIAINADLIAEDAEAAVLLAGGTR